MLKIGDKVKRIKGGSWAGLNEGDEFYITKIEIDKYLESGYRVYTNIGTAEWHDPANLLLIEEKTMKIGDKIKIKNWGCLVDTSNTLSEKLGLRNFHYRECTPYIEKWENTIVKVISIIDGYIGVEVDNGSQYVVSDGDFEIVDSAKEEARPVKKRKAYIEITKDVGKIYISLKIPEEVEEFFKTTSEGKTATSNAWFKDKVGVEFYKQPDDLEDKLTSIDNYVYSDFGSGLMRDDIINVAILRCVGASKGVKISSKGFTSFSNAELQNYVRRLGLYIKKLWESSISSTKIKSVITFEI